MNFSAEIDILPHKELLDPQGKAVAKGLQKMGYENVQNVRIGRHIHMELEAKNKEEAAELVDAACKKLLANPIMEGYHFELFEK